MERVTRRDGREGTLVLIRLRRMLTRIPTDLHTDILTVIPDTIRVCTSAITVDGDMAGAGAGARLSTQLPESSIEGDSFQGVPFFCVCDGQRKMEGRRQSTTRASATPSDKIVT